MQQKIKKKSYTIPFSGELIKEGKIVVSSLNLPTEDKESGKLVSIAVNINDNLSDLSQTQWQIVIPKKKVKQLRKALKKAVKF